jgi:hypothetical protein
MTTRFWNRRVAVTAYSVQQRQTITWEGLGVRFEVSQGSQSQPGKVCLRNLSPTSREFLNLPDVRLALRAGYDDDVAISGGVLPLLIDADVVRTQHRPPPLGWESEVIMSQGWHARGQRLTASFRGVSMAAVASKLADAIAEGGVEVGDFKADLRNTQWSTILPNRVVDGPALSSLAELIAGTGYDVLIIDRKLVLTPPDDITVGDIILVSPNTGMMGSPQPEWTERMNRRTPGSLRVQCKLMPAVRPGQRIRLESRLYSGDYTVFAITHSGDTHGDAWDTTLRVRRISNAVAG